MKKIFLLLILLCSYSIGAINLTLEEKIGQMFMVFFHGECVNDEARQLIQNQHVGGLIYYIWANGLHDPQQVQMLSSSLQEIAAKSSTKIPLLIAVDQEGGRVNRLTTGFTAFPSNEQVGKTGQPLLAKMIARGIAKELREVGIHMNLAPVADVKTPHSIIGDRSFGSVVNSVIQFLDAALEGYAEEKVAATLKHFPGYGAAEVDPHLGLPVVHKTKKELEACDLLPFKCLAKKAPAVMTAHLLMPALDADHCATFSTKIVPEFLRKEYGFDGVVISDSLVMEGALIAAGTIEEAAVLAILSGHDILLFGGKQLGQEDQKDIYSEDIARIQRYIMEQVNKGRITEERLNQSVERILKLKATLNQS